MLRLFILYFLIVLSSAMAGISIDRGKQAYRTYKEEPAGLRKETYRHLFKSDFMIAASLLLSGLAMFIANHKYIER